MTQFSLCWWQERRDPAAPGWVSPSRWCMPGAVHADIFFLLLLFFFQKGSPFLSASVWGFHIAAYSVWCYGCRTAGHFPCQKMGNFYDMYSSSCASICAKIPFLLCVCGCEGRYFLQYSLLFPEAFLAQQRCRDTGHYFSFSCGSQQNLQSSQST